MLLAFIISMLESDYWPYKYPGRFTPEEIVPEKQQIIGWAQNDLLPFTVSLFTIVTELSRGSECSKIYDKYKDYYLLEYDTV